LLSLLWCLGLVYAGCLKPVAELIGSDGGHGLLGVGPGDGGLDGGPDGGSTGGMPDGAMNCGPGSVLGMGTLYASGPAYYGAASGDLNGDGLLDLAVGGTGSGLYVLYGQADGGLTEPLYEEYGTGYGLAIADIDGDGLADLVATDFYALAIYYSLPGGGMSAPTYVAVSSPGGFQVTGVGVGDFNGDGLPDLVWSASGSAGMVMNLGGGNFGQPVALPAQGGRWGGVLVADLNADGKPDIVINGPSLYVSLSQAEGGYSTNALPFVGVGKVGGGIVAMRGPNDRVDLAALDENGIQLLANQGDGTFASAGQVGISGNAGYLTSGDFNGDCITDIAVSGFFECGDTTAVTAILYGLPGGGFGSPVTIDPGVLTPAPVAPLGPVGSPRALAVVDACGGGVSVLGDASKH
jgi:hypothetical protein